MSKIFLDLDGCFCDFVRAAVQTVGLNIEYKDVRWDFLGNDPAVWAKFDRAFWANLSWTPCGQQLYKALIERFDPKRLFVLTAPVDTDGCMDGKRDWIRKNMPELSKRYLIGPAKDFGTGFLVDDKDENIDLFNRSGGQGVLFPQPWNKCGYELTNHNKILDTLNYWVD